MPLADAVHRAYASAAIVGSSMLVEAINERAAAFYKGNGFVRLPDSLRLLCVPKTSNPTIVVMKSAKDGA